MFITIYDSVASIGDFAFDDCDSLETVYYIGSEADWADVVIGENNGKLADVTVNFN